MTNPTLAIATAPKRDSRHWSSGTITWDDLIAWMETPGTRKESGNYLLGTIRPTTVTHPGDDGTCTNLHRRKNAIVSRSAITLDIDTPENGFSDAIELTLPYRAIMHTTYSSTPDEPRYRLIIAVDRELAPDEYIIAAEALMQQLGHDQFDPGSSEPERYMFRPASQKKAWFHSWVLEGEPAKADVLLASFEKDLSSKPMPAPNRTKRDPYEIEGVVGAFNRAYEDWDLLIANYDLPYLKVDEDRYQLVGSSAEAGMGPIADTRGFVYSHHANDPAYGQTCSAFDLVRLHLYGHMDADAKPSTPINKMPSYVAMQEDASRDTLVISAVFDAITPEDLAVDDDDTDPPPPNWKSGFRTDRNMKILDHIQNWRLIQDNDPAFRVLYFNELTLSPEASDRLPWRLVDDQTRTFSDTDRWNLAHYLEETYSLVVPKSRVDSFVDTTASRRKRNPVREYLLGLKWDGNPRVEFCLPGVRANTYTRLVARKAMTAAVARMLKPGIKWDHTLVLFGSEGLGKSGWIDRMSKGHSAGLGRIDNKDTLLIMQRSWIMTADEGHSLRKADSEAMKEFLTRQSDVFRMPYDRETLAHPRHSVIWGTTNDEVFLRRQEGNRRFLIVHCEDKVDFEAMTDAYIDQVWAEAVELFHSGELLYLTDEESGLAGMERERFVEEDSLAGQIQEYLDQLVPADWWSKSPEGRINWMDDRAAGFEPEGISVINRVCSRQIWKEALRQRHEPRRVDLLDITESLKRIPGWYALNDRQRVPGYGPQLVFIREDLI